jgi:hypothetical protein
MTSTTGSGSATATTGGTGASGTTSGGASTTGAGSGTSTSSTSGGGFVQMPDGGGAAECDVWTQDCPAGEKCMPWANDGGGAWNATKCTPVDPNPKQVGDPCTADGGGSSGVDDCDIGTMCWNVDGMTGMGTCVGFCTGTPQDPMCTDPDDVCLITNEGVLILCLPICDPILQDCPGNMEGCYLVDGITITCGPDASGMGGVYGDPCEYDNVCDPGLYCAPADEVPNCQGSVGCCSQWCDLTVPNASSLCGGFADGQECLPYFDQMNAPPGFEDVGLCAMP